MLSPVASNVSVDLQRADQLYYEGAYEEALTIYSAAARSKDPAEQQSGLWAVAKIQASRGDNNAAERTIEAYRATEPTADADRQALLLLGTAEFAQGDFDEAREAFEDYIDRAGPAWPYAMLYLAQISVQAGDEEEAIEWIDQALLSELPAAVEADSLQTLATAHQSAGNTADALATYERAVEAAPTAADTAAALQRLADAAADAGQTATTAAALARIVREYPASNEALVALDQPEVATSTAITTRDRAIVLFRHQLNGEAGTAFQSIVDGGGGGAAEAHYYLGILAERGAQWDEAMTQYDAAMSLAGPDLKAQAAWDKATVLERLGRTDEAIAAYASVADILPTHAEAGNGTFRAGLLSYQVNRPANANVYWTRFAEVANNSEEEARAAWWLARTAEALGDATAAQAYYTRAAEADPLDYYGLRARALLNGETQLIQPVEAPSTTTDWIRFEAWLAGRAGPEDTTATTLLFSSEPWLRALEMIGAGLDDPADEELSALIESNSNDPWLTYRLLRAIGDHEPRPWITSPAAFQFLTADAPVEAFQLVYPLAYYQIAVREAAQYSYSPLLLLALIRQESLYKPGALSVAEAMGLTQVIPSTADGIAADLEIADFHYTDLLRPRVSLQFGAYYLGTLIEGFGGEVGPALAGYNGGPGNAGDWWNAGGGDRDLFLESIEFPETRAYVELVLENYARYLYAYGIVDKLSLPLAPLSSE